MKSKYKTLIGQMAEKRYKSSNIGPYIKVTVSGPQGSGKTQIIHLISRAFPRLRRSGVFPATKISFREIQTKEKL